MAVALKSRIFKRISDLTAFCALVGNNVTTVVSIVHDQSSDIYTLFYT